MRHPHLRTISKTPQQAQTNTQIKLEGTTAWIQMLLDIQWTLMWKDVWGPGTLPDDNNNDGGAFGGGVFG